MAQTVTVLFTDLVGSTALLSCVGEEEAETLRREHFALLRDAISVHAGQEVKNLGDGFMIVMPSAADAVAAAVTIQQRFQHRNRTAVEPLLVRVGVALGDADVDDGDYFGLPIIEAARLCSKAGGGEIFVTDVVRSLTGARGGFQFDPIGALDLKGLEQPVVTHRVTWTPSVADDRVPIPLPSRVGQVTSNFVGRSAERALLDDVLKAVAEGGRRAVLLSGEPGIGKTSLSSSFAKDAFGSDAAVLYGRSDEGLGIPYQAWCEALGHLVRHAPEALLTEHVDARGGELARLVPDLSRRLQVAISQTDAESERYLLFGAVTDVLARLSTLAPVVLILDDLQWADRPTVQLLRHVLTADVPLRLLVVGTFRDSEVGADHPLAETLASLHRESGVVRVPLRGLGDDELMSLMEKVAGHEMVDEGVDLRNALLAETEGNPFFVGEMLRHLAETGAIYQDSAGRWGAVPDFRASGLPVSIREVVERRIARLGDETRRVLALASIIGRDFDVDLLIRVVDVDEDTMLDLCDDAVSAAVLTEGEAAGQYAFAHALIEHALYDGLSASRKARSHRLVAETLEDLCRGEPGARVGELAYHWARATRPGDAGKAIDYAQRAGDRALVQLAPEEARRWYDQALELLDRAVEDDPRRRIQLMIGIGQAQRRSGDPGHRETLLDAAHLADSHDAVDLMVQAVLNNSRGWASVIGASDEERIAALQRALDRLGDVDSPERARLLGMLCAELQFSGGDLERRLELAEMAVDVARRTGDNAALAHALFYPAESIGSPKTLELRRERAAEACALTDQVGDTFAAYHANNYRALAALEGAELPTFRESSRIRDQISARVGEPVLRWNSSFHRVEKLLLHGDPAAAEQAAAEALEIGGASQDAFIVYGAQLLSLRWMQGRGAEMIPVATEAARDLAGLAVFRSVLAHAASFGDDPQPVVAMLDREVETNFPIAEDSSWLTGHALWAEAAGRVGHSAAAAVLLERLRPWHAQFVFSHISVHGSVAHYVGMLEHLLGRFDDAESSFRDALETHERLEAPFFTAWTKAAWAELLVDRADGEDLERAGAMAAEALAIAEPAGYAAVAAQARSLVARL